MFNPDTVSETTTSNKTKFAGNEPCPVRNVLDRIGDKWSTLILLNLHSHNKLRFSELQKNIDLISKKMLSKTLQSLERDGFVIRHIESQYPPVVYYSLSAMGKSLHERVQLLNIWATEHMDHINAHRALYDERIAKDSRAPWQKEKSI